MASACLSLSKSEPLMLTRENYDKIRSWCGDTLPPYDEVRQKYDANRRFFNNEFKLQEVIREDNEATKTGAKYDHETVKPERLTRILIRSCSQPGDLVVVPFSGSGTECAMAAKEQRHFIGYEIDQKHADTSRARCQKILTQPELFKQ